MATKEKENKTIYFKLNRGIKFETPDKVVSLNKLDGIVSGKVSEKDEIAYRMVYNALVTGILVKLEKEDKSKPEDVDILDVTNYAEDKAKHRLDASAYLRKLKKPELLDRISKIKDPALLSTMIDQETMGRNVAKRSRDDVLEAMKDRLQQLHKEIKTGIIESRQEEDKKVEYQPLV